MPNQEKESFIADAVSPDLKWVVVFEDNGETGYLYLCKWNRINNDVEDIIDHLRIYNQISPPIEECKEVFVTWAEDSSRAGFIVDNECWGIFDIASMRKMSAPREGGIIKEIDYKYWENGLGEADGEPIEPAAVDI